MKLDTVEKCKKGSIAIGEIIKTLQPMFEKTYNAESNSEWKSLRTKISYKDIIDTVKKLSKKPDQKENAEVFKQWISDIEEWFNLDTKPSWDYLFSTLNNLYRQAVNQMTAMMFTKMSLEELMKAQGQDPEKSHADDKYAKIANKYLASLDPYITEMDPYDFVYVLTNFIESQPFYKSLGIQEEHKKIIRLMLSQAMQNFLENTPEQDMIWRIIGAFEKTVEAIENNKETDCSQYVCWPTINKMITTAWEMYKKQAKK